MEGGRADQWVGRCRHPEVDVPHRCRKQLLICSWDSSTWALPEVFWVGNIIPLLEFQAMLSISEWQKWVSFLKFSEMLTFSGSCVIAQCSTASLLLQVSLCVRFCAGVCVEQLMCPGFFSSVLLNTEDYISLCQNIDMYSFNRNWLFLLQKLTQI